MTTETQQPVEKKQKRRAASATAKKTEIMELAKSGAPRPGQKTPLGSALANYINPKNGSYDEIFDKEIREAASNWFRATKQAPINESI